MPSIWLWYFSELGIWIFHTKTVLSTKIGQVSGYFRTQDLSPISLGGPNIPQLSPSFWQFSALSSPNFSPPKVWLSTDKSFSHLVTNFLIYCQTILLLHQQTFTIYQTHTKSSNLLPISQTKHMLSETFYTK